MSTDPEHRFELALQLGELKIAYQLAVEAEVRRQSSMCFLQLVLILCTEPMWSLCRRERLSVYVPLH